MQRSVMFYVICIASQAVIDIRYSSLRGRGHQKSSHDSSFVSMRTKKDTTSSAFPANSADAEC